MAGAPPTRRAARGAWQFRLPIASTSSTISAMSSAVLDRHRSALRELMPRHRDDCCCWSRCCRHRSRIHPRAAATPPAAHAHRPLRAAKCSKARADDQVDGANSGSVDAPSNWNRIEGFPERKPRRTGKSPRAVRRLPEPVLGPRLPRGLPLWRAVCEQGYSGPRVRSGRSCTVSARG
jgi:hypothetical protein